MSYDVICPAYWINEELIGENVRSWLTEVPTRKLLIGMNNPNIKNILLKLKEKHEEIELIDQTRFITLGGCLADLMKNVSTDWFVYVHADARILPKMFLVMEAYKSEDVGIIESHREEWKGQTTQISDGGGIFKQVPSYTASEYYFRDRSFSGFQLFQKKAVQPLIDRMGDDYVYRNEDMIFHAECLKNGYKYWKTWAMHVHQSLNSTWTYSDEDTHVMQYRGFIKYTEPNECTIIPCLKSIGYLKQKYGISITSILEMCYIHSNEWGEVIMEAWDQL